MNYFYFVLQICFYVFFSALLSAMTGVAFEHVFYCAMLGAILYRVEYSNNK
jgi:hypothetical protein